MNKKLVMVVVGVLIIAGGIVVFNNYGSSSDQTAGAGGAFDALGYNRTARIFNGTGATWCESKGLPSDCVGIYSPDKLIMKWTEDWDRGNDENWANPPYDSAWIDNEWNGKKDGSGSVWHYKIKWVGPCGADYTPLPDGGYCIWGQFETIMDQGVDPNVGPGHLWYAHALPNGYGTGQ
ncbi:MAG: hypothetical protein A3B14_00875 [Candidatus Zambryskibacteria bacterium RIFCSPLOWO2_01_FULL_45_21]|uniref:Uncharacterized protein n=1 Tax=Candidatus Zambryskibacteria bacterium RIFCSPLOWO2_01_FULL_45_21 TaxID=1802761 RepID=A0A1G2U0P8_9BACT|nr:MAG: hypothetical protein A3B14_00875 [Candidatus Zambryskibacteria bacterium RIFCSPLOWO2_01_FULL_45_21]